MTGTHGLPSGAYGTPNLIEPKFFKRESFFGPKLGWEVANTTFLPWTRDYVRTGISGRPTVFNWCYSSAALDSPLAVLGELRTAIQLYQGPR